MPPNLLLLLAAIFGFVLQALSTDGGGSVLARLGITPETWAIPKGAVAPLLVLFGLGNSILQNVQHGLSWPDAATQGAITSLLALGGAVGAHHVTGRDAEGHSLPVTPPKGLLILIGAAMLAVSVSACPAQGPSTPSHDADASGIVESGGQAADGLCKFIEGIDDNGIVRTICATVQEVADVVGFILTLRTSDAGALACVADAGAGVMAAKAAVALPGTSFCTTSAERAKSVVFLSHARSARLQLDAGAR